MTTKLVKWASNDGQITKSTLSDGRRAKFLLSATGFDYDWLRFKRYLGNVGLTSGFLAAIMILAVSPANAQVKFNAPAPKIAIVDVQAIMRESLSAKSVREQMDSLSRKEQAVLAEEEKKLLAQDQELQQQRALLTTEVYAKRRQALQADVRRLKSRSRDLRLALDQGFKRTMDQIQLVLFDELRKLSNELDFNMIFPRSQIVIAADDFDITKPALERLNKRLPSIKLKLEKSEKTDKAK